MFYRLYILVHLAYNIYIYIYIVCNLYKCSVYSYSRFLGLRLSTNMVLIIVVDGCFNHFVIIFYYYNTSSLVSIICQFSVWSETVIGSNKSELGLWLWLKMMAFEGKQLVHSKIEIDGLEGEPDFDKKINKFQGICGTTVKPRFTNASDHEQFGLRTNFLNTKRLGWRNVSRVTNTQAVKT